MLSAQRAHVYLFSGHGQIPQGLAIYEQFKSLSVMLEIDMKEQTILDASFTVLTPLTQRFLTETVVGYNLRQGIEPLLDLIRQRVHLNSQKSIIRALQTAYDKYYSVWTDLIRHRPDFAHPTTKS